MRPGATWTSGRVATTLALTLDLENDVSVFVPYAVVGGGFVWGHETEAGATAGLGLRGRIDARSDLTIELRGLWFDDPRVPGAVLTVGWRQRLLGNPR